MTPHQKALRKIDRLVADAGGPANFFLLCADLAAAYSNGQHGTLDPKFHTAWRYACGDLSVLAHRFPAQN